MNPLLVIGSSNIDLIMQMARLPAVGETVTDATFLQTFGGKGGNSAVAAARAGGRVRFLNCVGADAYTPAMLAMFEGEGIDTSLIHRETGISSGTALVMVGAHGDNYLSVAPGANYRLTPERIDAVEKDIARSARILLQCEVPAETNQRAIEWATKHGVPVTLNLAPARSMSVAVLRHVDTLIVNELEGRFLAKDVGISAVGDRDLARALREAISCRLVVVTLGAEGAVFSSRDDEGVVPAYKVEVVDTTAAGDTFCGVLSVAMAEGKTTGEALRFATAAAAICVGKLGASPSTPRRAEIDAFLKENS